MQVFADFALTSLVALTENTITVQDGARFPLADRGTGQDTAENKWFKVTMFRGNDYEICYVRTHAGDGVFADVLRGQEGTIAQEWPLTDTRVVLAATAADSQKFEAARFNDVTLAEAQAGTQTAIRNWSPFMVAQAVAKLAGASIPYEARTALAQLVAADKGKFIDITGGSFTQTFAAAATLGNGWYCYIKNGRTTDLYVQASSGQTIDGVNSGRIKAGMVLLVISDGARLHCVRIDANKQTERITTSQSWLCPLGVRFVKLRMVGGGTRASGGIYTNAKGGAYLEKTFTSSAGSAYTAVIGAGGTQNANTGGNSSFSGSGVSCIAAGNGGNATGGDINLKGAPAMVFGNMSSDQNAGVAFGNSPLSSLGYYSQSGSGSQVATGYGFGASGADAGSGLIILEY